ncbi:MAG: hypothetical protein C4K58_04810 [Flavobacteriaceae bacterium]|nr:MAG: hypothetical protein C4K58_04810 [Flavobacteriaceae bacterium]
MTKEEKFKQAALDYHSMGRRGKIQVVPTKPHSSQKDLALAYSPGVAEPCKAIEAKPADAYKYTAKGNLVAVISNGTAVLGLGDIGALASKPVMEGKGLLFKIFADLDVFDIEVDEKDPEKFIQIVKAIAPTFGGINLEDIKAPEAFEIERRLKEELDIPVMHDDQHGTAIISAAALINALELTGKKMDEIKIVINGAGAAAIACGKLYVSFGAKIENIIMCDSQGVIGKDRGELSEQKEYFRTSLDVATLEEAAKGCDVLIGLSKGNVFTPEMLLSMAEKPIVFAMANPVPEIDYNLAKATRPDCIMATGRSDFPNQVNNVLGFPFIFRGALDVASTSINEEMKKAAVIALAELAKEAVPEFVVMAYNEKNMSFGSDYIIPKPFDNRLIDRVSMAVAKAAMDSGVARKPIENWDVYREELLSRKDEDDKILRAFKGRARRNPKTIVLTNGDEYRVLKAAQILEEEGLAKTILLGNHQDIQRIKEANGIENDFTIIDPKYSVMKTPTSKELVSTAKLVNDAIKSLGLEPNIAMLGYENFRCNSQISQNVVDAVEYLHEKNPNMVVDGPIQPDYALDEELLHNDFPFSKLTDRKVNTFVFPDTASGSLSSKVLRGLHKSPTIGPILLGMQKPVHVMQSRAQVEEIVNLSLVAVIHAQLLENKSQG